MKKLLIVVDYQNDFVTGSLGFKDAKKIEKPILNEIQKYSKNKDKILFLKDTHDRHYLKTIEGKNLPIIHTIKGTGGWEIYGKIYDFSNKSNTLEKNTFGCEKLINYLKKNKFDSIQISGLLTNMCVLVNAIIAKTIQPNTQIFLNKKCCASNDASLEECAYKILKNLHIKII